MRFEVKRWKLMRKRQKFRREKGVCSVCGTNHNLTVHHKNGNFKCNSKWNLQVVCVDCHKSIHRGVI